jgi:catechol 2,3-dioxygenase-like lactoylglutathione lyase family enzyme
MTRRQFIAGLAATGTALVANQGDAMQGLEKTKVLFIAGFGPIVGDVAASRKLYGGTLAIPFKEEGGGYLHTDALQGAKSFALWPLSQAAQSCFGHESWPTNLPVPQAWLEFDVENVVAATAELEAQGHRMLIRNKTEPWGQTVSRFMDPDGLLVGLTFTPWLREKK